MAAGGGGKTLDIIRGGYRIFPEGVRQRLKWHKNLMYIKDTNAKV